MVSAGERLGRGSRLYNHAIAHAYRSLGHEVTVIARRNDAKTPAYAEVDGIRIHRLLTRDHYYWRRTPLVGFLAAPSSNLPTATPFRGRLSTCTKLSRST